MTIVQGVALFIAAILAGALNSVAGGGSFISFPTLLFTGVPSIAANATNTVALWPGSLASIPPYRKDLTHERREVIIFSIVSVLGGVLGAVILLRTPQSLFSAMIPWLLLIATLIFAFGNNAAQWLRQQRAQAQGAAEGASAAATGETTDEAAGAEGSITNISRDALIVVLIIQFVISLYGGFFGGGIGIMMLAGFALLGMRDIHAMNALKVVLASIINGVAIVAFAIAGAIYWPQALLMVVGSVIGGYGGAALAHQVPPKYVRWFAIAVGLIISAYFFIKQGV
ncbi:MAG TPA: sulfite exporter TauE/SafE family protein [Ktedonobacterales bacterium]|nr:sulfite exporter TauE/SafE family protein [Ktedonobacterales bacterium]